MVLKRKNKPAGLEQKRKLITAIAPRSPISEQYRTIRTNVQFSAVSKEIRSIIITSAGPGEGKSTTVANLAITFAQQGKKVLLVDADLRKPTTHYSFNISNTFGFTNVLIRQMSLDKVVRETDVQNLMILTSGPVPPNPAELLASEAMDQFFREAYLAFDIVLFDTPPVLAVTDAQILANKCDGTILVAYCNKSEKDKIVKAKESLQSAQGKLLGVVLNHKEVHMPDYYYYGAK